MFKILTIVYVIHVYVYAFSFKLSLYRGMNRKK